MNKPTEPVEPEALVASAEARLSAEAEALEAARKDLRIAQIDIAKGIAGAEQRADALAAEVSRRRDAERVARELLDAARAAQAEIVAGATAGGRASEMEAIEKQARRLRGKLKALDARASEFAEEYIDAARAADDLADSINRVGPWRDEIRFPQKGHVIASILYNRLAMLGVFPSRMPFLDRSAEPQSVQQHFEERLLAYIAPGPGRPPKGSTSGAEAPPSTNQEAA